MKKLFCALGLCLVAVAVTSPATAATVTFEVAGFGNFTVVLYDSTPLHRDNFLAYVNAGLYDGTIIHRSEVSNSGTGERVYGLMQGGSYVADPVNLIDSITTFDSIALEADLGGSNTYMTLGAARTPEINSATAGWFINMADNSGQFDPESQYPGFPGYTVFGHVVAGQDVLEEMFTLNRWNFGGDPLTTTPMMDSFDGTSYPLASDWLTISSAYDVTPTPEPGVLGVMGVGMAGLIARGRRKRKNKK